MGHAVGVLAMEHIAAGLVEDDRLVGPIRTYPDQADGAARAPCGMPRRRSSGHRPQIDEVGEGQPARRRGRRVSRHHPQRRGRGVAEPAADERIALARSLSGALGGRAHVLVVNDADAVAAGIAATRGQLDTLTRVWTLGSGVGFGRYPHAPGVWEGGHVVVSLDPKE